MLQVARISSVHPQSGELPFRKLDALEVSRLRDGFEEMLQQIAGKETAEVFRTIWVAQILESAWNGTPEDRIPPEARKHIAKTRGRLQSARAWLQAHQSILEART
jgi:hypothetical protein